MKLLLKKAKYIRNYFNLKLPWIKQSSCKDLRMQITRVKLKFKPKPVNTLSIDHQINHCLV